MPGTLWVGTCGWSMAQQRYFQQFNAIEIQATFYNPPSPETAARWAARAPQGFAFSVKAWQLITHPASSPTYRRLKRPLSDTDRAACGFFAPSEVVETAFHTTMAVAEAVRARAVLFQTPASFTPTDRHVDDLRTFFRAHPPQGRLFVWEPRGGWPERLVQELCDELGLVHGTDPFTGRLLEGRAAYLRLHGRGGYRYRYRNEELDELAQRTLQLVAGREETWCLFNNVWMAEDAGRFLQRMQQARSA